MRVTYPRVLCVRRSDPFRLSVGDSAIADFGPGLLDLLNLRDARGARLGEGFAPEWVTALGAAATAAYAVVGEEFNTWTASSHKVELHRPAAEGETAVATVTIEEMLLASIGIGYRIVGRETQDAIAEGKLVFVSMGPNGPARFTPRRVPFRVPEPAAWSREAEVLPTPAGRAAGSAPIRWQAAALSLALHEMRAVSIEVSNTGSSSLDGEVAIANPFGFGLTNDQIRPIPVRLSPGETTTVWLRVTALRPDEVNLGRPWPLVCSLRSGGRELDSDVLRVSVPDPSPGLFFYVLTEDCETFDGGEKTGNYGSARNLGNHNDFMDPEEYRVQMIRKPDALNAIADKHGARWTHFWTVPQRFAAEWAAGKSKTGAWSAVVAELDDSIRRGSRRHEYAPHIHFDYEPESRLPPQPRLIYDPGTDGILPNEYYDPIANPNHKYHGWDGARKGIAYVRAEGDLSDPDSKIGSLRKATRHLAGLSFLGRPTASARTGAADFGGAVADIAASRSALFANGLVANSDSGIYPPPTPLPRGRQIYFCSPKDLEAEVDDLREASLVQLRAGEVTLEAGTEALNAWFERRYRESRRPGVDAAVAMTHAMFMRGAPDPFRDTEGGDFDALDHHLEYVRRTYPEVRFATATEASIEFLDYYTPVPRAVASKLKARSADGRTLLYAIRVLGKGIPVSAETPVRVRVQAPPFLEPRDVRSLTVLDQGVPLAGPWQPGERELPFVEFPAIHRDGYELRIETLEPVGEELCGVAPARTPPASETAIFEEPAEEERPDLLRLDPPRLRRGEEQPIAAVREGDSWEWTYPGDLFHFLVNPVAGSEHPLGRRLHPYGRISEGIAIDAALRLFGDSVRPVRFELEWVRPVRGRADFALVTRIESVKPETIVTANAIHESGVEVARVRLVLART